MGLHSVFVKSTKTAVLMSGAFLRIFIIIILYFGGLIIGRMFVAEIWRGGAEFIGAYI